MADRQFITTSPITGGNFPGVNQIGYITSGSQISAAVGGLVSNNRWSSVGQLEVEGGVWILRGVIEVTVPANSVDIELGFGIVQKNNQTSSGSEAFSLGFISNFTPSSTAVAQYLSLTGFYRGIARNLYFNVFMSYLTGTQPAIGSNNFVFDAIRIS